VATSSDIRVLVVDDEEINRLFLVDLLKMNNILPDQARDGKDAIKKWQNNTYTAILMDIQMPVMDGFDAARTIRQLEKESGRQQTPIIAVTAYHSEESKFECTNSGMDTYIPKPVVIADLLKVILPLSGQ
jgi:CheY-like chemotaxis protein